MALTETSGCVWVVADATWEIWRGKRVVVAGGCAYWLALLIRIGDPEIGDADEMVAVLVSVVSARR